jgi:hypothetical protein
MQYRSIRSSTEPGQKALKNIRKKVLKSNLD